jgi:trehalose 2-sulfotransferase
MTSLASTRDTEVSEPVCQSYFVSATPRSGSSLLAEALEFTTIAGRPREYFDPGHEKSWWTRLGITADTEYVAKIVSAATTPNGVFGAKVHWHQFLHLRKKIRLVHGEGTSDLELLRSAFPDLRFIFLTRRDKVQQAVSYYKALRTDCWHSLRPDATITRETPVPAPISASEPSFDFDQIDRWVTRFTNDEASWCRYFATVGLEPFEVVYEDFIGTYESTVLDILRYLSIPITDELKIAPPRLCKLADLVSEEWALRYRALKWPSRPLRGTATRTYFIATGPRTGGFLLAEALESTQIAGRPREYFDPVFQQQWCGREEINSDTEYFEKVLTAGTTRNGVFGAKVLWHQFEHLMIKLRLIESHGLSVLELLRRAFPELRYVLLTRKDKIRQAVSYDRAIRSGVWWSIPNETNGKEASPSPASAIAPPFDFERIDEWVTRLTEFDSNWRRHFKRTGIEVFEVAYEDLVESYESTVLTVLRYLDLPVSAGLQVAPPRLQKQADDVTEEWVRRYQEFKR